MHNIKGFELEISLTCNQRKGRESIFLIFFPTDVKISSEYDVFQSNRYYIRELYRVIYNAPPDIILKKGLLE